MSFFRTKKYVDVTNLPSYSNRKNRDFAIKKVKPVVLIKRAKSVVLPKKVKQERSSPTFSKKIQGLFSRLESLKKVKQPKIKPRMQKPVRIAKQNQPVALSQQLVGEITHFFTKISVCVIKLKKDVSVGDKIYFKGSGCDFSQKIVSMQVDHKNVDRAVKGQEVGLKVIRDVSVGCDVFR